MVIGVPYNFLLSRSSVTLALVNKLTSEQWSVAGFLSLALIPVAGYFRFVSAYGVLLILHELCDINDGSVYAHKEKGILNGYGLYLDHMLDSIGACFVACGTFFLLDSPFACVVGLTLYYLIAIHSWLYKINKVAVGECEGTYFGVMLSARKKLLLNVDDLKLLLIVATGGNFPSLLLFIVIALAIVFVLKVGRTMRELRRTLWHLRED